MMRHHTDPQNILRIVDIVFQVMEKASSRYNGLFPAVAERHHGSLLMDFPLPPVIPGQRNSDRSPRGCNLSHDVALLETLHGMAEISGKASYRKLYDDYLHTFATECATASPTGLLPWGEHSYWKLTDGSIGNSYLLQYAEQPLDAGIPTHHQLGILSGRIWTSLARANPDLLPRFVDGLDWHWMNEERTLFNRHAPITQFIRGYQIKRQSKMTGTPLSSMKGSDFPNAAGYYIHNYAAALSLAQEPKAAWKEALKRFTDSWWDRRLSSGLLPKDGKSIDSVDSGSSIGMTTGLAISMIEASKVLTEKEPELSKMLAERSAVYAEAVLSVPQPRAAECKLAVSFGADGNPDQFTQDWSGNRGNPITAKSAISWLKLGDHVSPDKALELVEPAAAAYLESYIPRDQIVRAGDPAFVISLMTEMYRRTNDSKWVDAAIMHATDALELYFDCPLPRMSLGRKHYESQQGSSELVHALARLAYIGEGVPLKGGLERPM